MKSVATSALLACLAAAQAGCASFPSAPPPGGLPLAFDITSEDGYIHAMPFNAVKAAPSIAKSPQWLGFRATATGDLNTGVSAIKFKQRSSAFAFRFGDHSYFVFPLPDAKAVAINENGEAYPRVLRLLYASAPGGNTGAGSAIQSFSLSHTGLSANWAGALEVEANN